MRSCGSTRYLRDRQSAPTALLGILEGWTPCAPPKSRSTIDCADRGNPFFLEESVRTLVETGVLAGESVAYAWRSLSRACRCRHRAGGPGGSDRPLSTEEKRFAPDGGSYRYRVPLPLLQAIADLPRSHSGEVSPISRPPSSSMRRISSRARLHLQARAHHEVAYGSLLRAGGPSTPASSKPSRAVSGPAYRAGRTAGLSCSVGEVGRRPSPTAGRPVPRRHALCLLEAVARFEQRWRS